MLYVMFSCCCDLCMRDAIVYGKFAPFNEDTLLMRQCFGEGFISHLLFLSQLRVKLE